MMESARPYPEESFSAMVPHSAFHSSTDGGGAAGMLDYQRKPAVRPVTWAARAIEITGGIIFLVGGTGLISAIFADDRFLRMSWGDIVQELLLICFIVGLGGMTCVCGHALRKGSTWAGSACAVILATVILLLLLAL